MCKELTIKQNDFLRLLNREKFLLKYFNAKLRYRLPAINNERIYIEVICDEKIIGEHAEQYILSYLEPKHTKSISYPKNFKQISFDELLLNRLMKEYLVHIEIEDKDNCYTLVFRSTTLAILFLAIDDFRNTLSNIYPSDQTFLVDTESALQSLSNNFERQVTLVDENDQLNEDKLESSIMKSRNDDDDDDNDDDDEDGAVLRKRTEPPLKISFPGAAINARDAPLEDFLVKPKKQKHSSRQSRKFHSTTSTINDNDLVHEMREKLKGRRLRDVIIDGANIGRTYGVNEFSAVGIKLVVDLFQSYGYPDSKIIVIIPAHYLSKDKEHVFPNLIRRKILHKSFEQKNDEEVKRFYDDRLIVDLAVMRQGVILSNDFYRDLLRDSGDAVRKTIRERLLCYRFVGDNLCLPNPVSEGGLSLDKFLTM